MSSIKVQPLKQVVSRSISLPGCIGYTIRALNIAVMTKGSVKIVHPLKSDDTYAMVNALRMLGIEIEEEADAFVVHGDTGDVKEAEYEVNVGLSGRSARTLLALLSIVPGTKTMTCAEPFKKRPIGDLVDGLKQLGADISYLEESGHLPVKISSQRLKPGTVRMPGALSSQYFSAIMMIAPLVGDISIEVLGEQSSQPFIDMTIGIMKTFGVKVTNRQYHTYHVSDGQQYKNPKSYTVEPEATSASYFFAIAALTRSTIRILDLGPDSLQGDATFADVLEQMGCRVRKNAHWIEVTGTDHLHGVTVDMNDTPDLVPTLSVVAAFAEGQTTITGIAHARVKETDRIESPRRELAKMGVRTEATASSLTIYGGAPKAATIETYHDHRMAMAFAVAGLRVPGVVIKDPQVVGKSFPTFWKVLNSLQTKPNIVLIGMRGSGKSTVGRLLAKRLNREFINMDKLLEDRTGMPIADVVARRGWDYFRAQESALAQDLADTQNAVISTGGGVILRPENIETLARHGQFIFLDGSIDTLISRIQDEPGRPPLTEAKTLQQELGLVLQQREATYKKIADFTVSTDHRTPEQIAETIIQKIGETL